MGEVKTKRALENLRKHAKRELELFFFFLDFNIYTRCVKCLLHIAPYAPRIEYLSWSSKALNF